MKLRQLLGVFAGLIAAMPLAARAQVGDKPPPPVAGNEMLVSIFWGGPGSGYVSMSSIKQPLEDQKSCTSDCTKVVAYPIGIGAPRTITLTASPMQNSSFAGWGGPICSGTNPICEIPVSRQTARVVAYFRLNSRTVAAGAYHTCVLQADGGVVCWGLNTDGQSGLPISRTVSLPTTASTPIVTNAVAVAAGGYHTCALMADRSVKCWGNNWEGELGVGGPTHSSTPIVVPGIREAVAVTAGGFHTCIVEAGGQAYCWGLNKDGQLGVSKTTTTLSTAPVQVLQGTVGDLSNMIAAGGFHTCAIVKADSTVACWGRNAEGQLGIGKTSWSELPGQKVKIDPSACTTILPPPNPGCSTGVLTASIIAASIGVGQIGGPALGGYHTVAVDAQNQDFAWGHNDNNSIPSGADSTVALPGFFRGSPLGGIGQVSHIAAGAYHMCITSSTGGVLCRGNNDYGQSGRGQPGETIVPLPSGVTAADVTYVAAGGYHTCAVFGGEVNCWGQDLDGQVDGKAGGANVLDPTSVFP